MCKNTKKMTFFPKTSVSNLITFHSIVGESFTELVDHNESNANWVVSAT